MPVSAHDVARELRQRLPGAGDVKIHKLLYYCQGWHLARHDAPAFAEDVQAWANGPVVADLWRDEKHDRPIPPPSPLSPSVLEIVDYVVSRYGRLSGAQLIHRTHQESPWREVSELASFNQVIAPIALKSFFAEKDSVNAARMSAFVTDRSGTVAHKEWRAEIARQIEEGDPAEGLDAKGIRELFRA